MFNSLTQTIFHPFKACQNAHWNRALEKNRQQLVHTTPSLRKYALFILSLVWIRLTTSIFPRQHWWDIITDTGPHHAQLYLGALPLCTPFHNHLNILKNKVGAVLSMVEPFENNWKGIFSSAITPSQWIRAGIKNLQISIPDYGTGPLKEVEKGVEFIRWNILNNRSVYVHCKAGKGRSALIVLAYLIKYHNLSRTQAIALMKSKRIQAGFGDFESKMDTLRAFEKKYYRAS